MLERSANNILLRKAWLGVGLTSFGFASFIFVLGIATLLSEEEFGRFAIVYAAGLLLAAFPAYGIGPYLLSALIRQVPLSDIAAATILAIVYACGVTVGLLVIAFFRQYLSLDLLAVYILFLGNSAYVISEQVSRGVQGMARLVAQRVSGSASLCGALLVIVLLDERSAVIAALSRGVALLIIGGWFLRAVSPSCEVRNAPLIPALSSAGAFFIGAMFMVGIQSLDKLVLSLTLPLEELGRYSALFIITLMIGNRLSDVFQVMLLDKKRAGDFRLSRNYIGVAVLAVTAVFLFILCLAFLAEVLFLRLNFSVRELLLYCAAATLLFVSDVLWWTDSVTRGNATRFCIVGLALLAILIVGLLLLPFDSITRIGLFLLILFSTSVTFAIWSLNSNRGN